MTADTIWCASYPKSGNTWLRALLGALTSNGHVTLRRLAGHSSGNDEKAIFREFGISPSILSDQLANELMAAVGASVATRSTADHVFRKTHRQFASAEQPGSTHVLATPCRAIYVVRDPRAVAVSVAHHMGYSLPEAVDLMRRGPIAIAKSRHTHLPSELTTDRYRARGCQVAFDWGSWTQNVTSWLGQTQIPLLLVRYEDMSHDPIGQARRIAEWLDLNVDDATVRRAVEASGFERLANQEAADGFIEAAAPDRPFFRRGTTDGWRDELPSDLQDQLLTEHGEVMRTLGYLSPSTGTRQD